ncbi:hypothetical protein [Desulfonema magnum]|uniref:Uncharacterized protein n=1 Tax=Desulfonema magnum TaxID=45655 RepID=A0A975BG72_9BACT|nr:hypothetical protein [Desulfonema magnum]QTA84827.1 Uncharacterized protein dnm_008280 [Desulfonema magnum]
MKKLGYKNTYHRVVTKANLEKIKHILNEYGYYDEMTVDQIEYEKKDDLPYFILNVDSPEYIRRGSFAMSDGIFIEIGSVIREWEGIFYLPILIIRETTNETLKPFINPDMLMEHELHHLRHIIEHIDQHPDYIEKSRKHNVGSCTFADIQKSIEFEVGKIFSNEMPALISDYENGERDYYLYSDGVVSVITSHDKNEFVRYNIAQYIAKLRIAYIDRFPEKKSELSEYIEKEVNKQGKSIFGENTMSLLSVSLFKVMLLAEIKGKHYEIEERYL